MQLKPSKRKVFISLVPFYFFIFLIPLFPALLGWNVYAGGKISNVGLFFEGVAWFFYSLFILLCIPFAWFLEIIGLVKNFNSFPEISLPGLFLLAVIYSAIIYLLISFFQKKK